jgi:pilus assembly protein CpaB
MNMRSLLLVVGALLVAVITAVAARSMLAGSASQQAAALPAPTVEQSRILVAAVPLPVGKILLPEDLKFQAWPKEGVEEAFMPEGSVNIQDLVGKVVRLSIPQAGPVTKTSIVGPGEQGFLAAVLKPGMRAVSVSVNNTTGVAGFVFPGDRVDLVLTHEIDVGTGTTRKASETILNNVRVLAADQRTSDQDNQPIVSQTVTLEVSPKDVEVISVMQRMGSIGLSLRALAGRSEDEANAPKTAEVTAVAPVAAVTPATPAPTQTAALDATKAAAPTVPAKAPAGPQHSFTLDSEVSQVVSKIKPRASAGAAAPAIAPMPMPMAAPPPSSAPPARAPVRAALTVSRGTQVTPVGAQGE